MRTIHANSVEEMDELNNEAASKFLERLFSLIKFVPVAWVILPLVKGGGGGRGNGCYATITDFQCIFPDSKYT